MQCSVLLQWFCNAKCTYTFMVNFTYRYIIVLVFKNLQISIQITNTVKSRTVFKSRMPKLLVTDPSLHILYIYNTLNNR